MLSCQRLKCDTFLWSENGSTLNNNFTQKLMKQEVDRAYFKLQDTNFYGLLLICIYLGQEKEGSSKFYLWRSQSQKNLGIAVKEKKILLKMFRLAPIFRPVWCFKEGAAQKFIRSLQNSAIFVKFSIFFARQSDI